LHSIFFSKYSFSVFRRTQNFHIYRFLSILSPTEAKPLKTRAALRAAVKTGDFYPVSRGAAGFLLCPRGFTSVQARIFSVSEKNSLITAVFIALGKFLASKMKNEFFSGSE
jgi:hypothetical protein